MELSPEEIKDIHRMYNRESYSIVTIAEEMGLSFDQVFEIVIGS